MVAAIFFMALVAAADALKLGLCSSQNSAGGSPVSYQYMSNGYCTDHCSAQGFSYAVLQRFDCWCTNTLPQTAASGSNCDLSCPGYPVEKCSSDGYFGYVDIASPDSDISLPSPSGSSRAASSASSSSSSSGHRSSSSSSSSTSTSSTETSSFSGVPSSEQFSSGRTTSTSSGRSSPARSSSSPSSSAASTSSSAPDSASDLTSAATTIYSTKTVDGGAQVIRTEYVTTIAAAATSSSEASPSASDNSNNKTFFDSKGKVAGTFTAVGVVVVGLVLGVLYCCCCMKRPASDDDDFTDEENRYSSDESFQKQPTPKTNESLARDNSSKSLFTMLTKESTQLGGISRNLSKKRLNPKADLEPPMFPISEFDTRLDTFFLNANQSNQTFGDEQDYSRKLKITNPDTMS